MIALLAASVVAAGLIDPRLGALAFFAAFIIAAAAGGRRPAPVRVIRQMPTRYQQAREARWVPGAGIGVGFWHGLRPFAFLTIHRWRR